MPVTAKLSRKFYETFGDDVANELVNWFNQVDATYRSEFRELFEVHFARFDAKLEQRIAELRSELRSELHGIESTLHGVESKLIRWMFVFWIGQAATTVGLVLGVVKLTAH